MANYIHKPAAFQVMAKPIGAVCNLNCTYCYYLGKKELYKGKLNFRMDEALLEDYIKKYIDSQQVPVVSFVWQGGESSLLGLGFFKRALELQQKYAGNKQIENAFQTNGTNLDDAWCAFLKEHNFLVGISIDGPEEIHNKYRVYKSGKPSFADVLRGIDLLKKYGIDFNTLTVVHRLSAGYPLEVYRFLKDIGSRFMQFTPVVERVPVMEAEDFNLVLPSYRGEANVTDWSVCADDYGRFLVAIFDEWVRNDVGRYYIQLFDAALANWVGESPGVCVFAETCGDDLVMEHNGDVYSCDHFVFPAYFLGNIRDKSLLAMAHSKQQNQFGRNKLDGLPTYCLECEYRFACHGECPKHRFIRTPNGEAGLSYLCVAYKMFFSHVHPYMQFMSGELSNKRPPANVMTWARNVMK